MELLNFILSHWVEWLFAVIIAILSYSYRKIFAKLKEEHEKNEAIAEGVKALLRESIVDGYNKYSDKGYCPIYAKESIKKAFGAYHALGGNDVATELYNKILKMDEDGKEAKHEGLGKMD